MTIGTPDCAETRCPLCRSRHGDADPRTCPIRAALRAELQVRGQLLLHTGCAFADPGMRTALAEIVQELRVQGLAVTISVDQRAEQAEPGTRCHSCGKLVWEGYFTEYRLTGEPCSEER